MEKTVGLHSSYVEKTVEIPQCSSSLLDKVIDMPVDMRLQVPVMVQTVPKTWSSQVQFLDHVALPVVCKTEVQTVQKPVGVRTGAVLGQGLHACNDRCWDGPDSAENCGVSAVGADFRTRLSTCPCWTSRGLFFLGPGRLFWAVYTGTRPGLTPAIRVGKGWRGRQELAPRRSATQLGACAVRSYRQRHVRYTLVRTTTTTTTTTTTHRSCHFGSSVQ